jgi:acyl-CoA synthetase (AMP-forming)/AMP-acid ligase II
VLDAFEKKFGVLILEGYGLTETASTTTFNISAEERKAYSVGKPIWGVEVQVWDKDEQVLLPGDDNVGEIVVRGVNVMKGYHNNPHATAAAFTRGWMRTGDLGYFDEDGYLFIVDRKKDLIIRGGYNVYPREVEEALYAHPGVAEAAVIGVPDERLGEEVKAFIIPREGVTLDKDEVIDFLKERLAAYKYPRIIEFRSQMEHGPTGKILKTVLNSAGGHPRTSGRALGTRAATEARYAATLARAVGPDALLTPPHRYLGALRAFGRYGPWAPRARCRQPSTAIGRRSSTSAARSASRIWTPPPPRSRTRSTRVVSVPGTASASCAATTATSSPRSSPRASSGCARCCSTPTSPPRNWPMSATANRWRCSCTTGVRRSGGYLRDAARTGGGLARRLGPGVAGPVDHRPDHWAGRRPVPATEPPAAGRPAHERHDRHAQGRAARPRADAVRAGQLPVQDPVAVGPVGVRRVADVPRLGHGQRDAGVRAGQHHRDEPAGRPRGHPRRPGRPSVRRPDHGADRAVATARGVRGPTDKYDLSALRIIALSGSPLSPELGTRAMDLFGDVVYNLYGSTEVAYATIATPADLRAAPGTVGRPPYGTTVALLDADGHARGRGERGRVFVGNAVHFGGYTDGATKETIAGLMSTGDVGHFDADNRLFIDGRDDDMIVSGGENVYPAEIAGLLAAHPAIADAAVIGVPDDRVRPAPARLCRAATGRNDRRGRDTRARQGQPGAVQEPPRGRLRRRDPPQRRGEGRQAGAARTANDAAV